MNPNVRVFSLAPVLLLLASVGTSQEELLEYRRVEGSAGKVHYDLGTGEITKLVRPRRATATDRPMSTPRGSLRPFRNTVDTGYFTTVRQGAEYIDWATKNTGGRLMTSFVFAYGTVERDIGAGGPGASLDLSFYSGTGVCLLGQETLRISFAGLPGETASIFPGFGATYVVTAMLATPGLLPDGPIGWGYGAPAPAPGVRPMSNTGPCLTDFGTNTGWQDNFQWWKANPASLGTCLGTFFYGGCLTGNVPPTGTGGTPCASFYMEICDMPLPQTATCSARNPGLNPNTLTWNSPPALCKRFVAQTATPVALYAISGSSLAGHPLSGLVNGDLLINPAAFYGSPKVIRNGLIEANVPCDLGLIGTNVHVQAAELAGPGNLQLTNALDCTIGG